MAIQARNLAKGYDAIYHGTHYAPQVLRSGKLIPRSTGLANIPLTRSPEIAAYFALMQGREPDGWSGAILVLNKRSLAQRYRLEPFHDECALQDEQEEIIWDRKVNFRRHLLGTVRESELQEEEIARRIKYI